MMKKIEIIGLKTLAILDQAALVAADQAIYAAPPWNEYKKCSNPNCTKYWGIEQKIELDALNYEHCGLPVMDYSPADGKDGLLEKFKNISKKPLFEAALAYDVDSGKIVGYCFGYQINLDELDLEFKPLSIEKLVRTKVSDKKPLIYLSSISVDSNYRGMGVAKRLSILFFEQNKNNGWMITRTKGGKDPSVTNAWFCRLGFELLLSYDDDSCREIQFAKIGDLMHKST